MIGFIKGDARSLDYSSYRLSAFGLCRWDELPAYGAAAGFRLCKSYLKGPSTLILGLYVP